MTDTYKIKVTRTVEVTETLILEVPKTKGTYSDYAAMQARDFASNAEAIGYALPWAEGARTPKPHSYEARTMQDEGDAPVLSAPVAPPECRA